MRHSSTLKRVCRTLVRYIGLLSFGLALLLYFRTCNHEARLDDMQRRVNSAEYRPRLAVASLDSDSIEYVPDSSSVEGRTLSVYVNVRLTGMLRVVNRGNSAALMLARISGDTVSGSYWLRRLLRSGILHNITEDRLLDYGRECIDVDETLSIPICHTFAQIDEDSGAVLHYLLLYENEIGRLYDSYVWIQVRTPHMTEAPFGAPVMLTSEVLRPSDASIPYHGRPERDVRRHLSLALRHLDTHPSGGRPRAAEDTTGGN